MKYRLTDETRIVSGKTLHRIERPNGEKGGFVESEANLSQEGAAWVHPDGLAYDGSRVVENAQVYGVVRDYAAIRGAAELYGEAADRSVLGDRAKVYGSIGGNTAIFGDRVVAKDERVD